MFSHTKKLHQAIDHLANSVRQSAIVNHQFYQLWRSHSLNYQQTAIFCLHYDVYDSSIIENYDSLLVAARKHALQPKTFEAVIDMNENKQHTSLLKLLFDTLLSKLNNEDVMLSCLPRGGISTKAYDIVVKRGPLFRDYPIEFSCGFLLAQSWILYIQAPNLYSGINHYQHYFTLPEFHSICQKFYSLMGLDDQSRQQQSLELTKLIVKNDKQFTLCQDGFNTYINLLSKYWHSIYKKVIALNHSGQDHVH